MSYLRNKPLLITGGVVALSVLLAVISHYGNGMPKKIATGIIMPVEKVASWAIRPFARFCDDMADASSLREENEKLKAEIAGLQAENRSVEDYIRENGRLMDMLALRDNLTGKEVISASVVSVDNSGYNESVVINRGEKDGISEGDAVVTAAGVVGRVSEVGSGWSTVTTVLSPGHSLGVKIARTGDIAVADGDVSLVREKLVKLDYLTPEVQIIEGDIIETSGVGGIYPPGLIVGKIRKIKKDNSGRTDYAVIEPTADFSRLYEVTVITEWERESKKPVYIDGNDVTSGAYETHDEISSSDIENAEG